MPGKHLLFAFGDRANRNILFCSIQDTNSYSKLTFTAIDHKKIGSRPSELRSLKNPPLFLAEKSKESSTATLDGDSLLVVNRDRTGFELFCYRYFAVFNTLFKLSNKSNSPTSSSIRSGRFLS